jgi:hypothetical protein
VALGKEEELRRRSHTKAQRHKGKIRRGEGGKEAS